VNPSRTRLAVLGAGALVLLGACENNPPRYRQPGAAGATGSGGGMGGAGSTTGVAGGTGGGAGTGGTGVAGAAGTSTGVAGTGTGVGGASGGTAGTGGAPILVQTGNPVYDLLTPYRSWLNTAAGDAAKLVADRTLADNIITWQMPHGGFYKNDRSVYAAAWDGSAARSGWRGANDVELGTIDNEATVTELMFLADVYRRTTDVKYRDSARKAMDFLLTMQAASGGFPQVYPARVGTTYSNYVTFNDNAMVRVLILFDQAGKQVAPLGGDLFTAEQHTKMAAAIAGAVDYILKAQIIQSGVKTVWCAQHDPVSYVPRGARSYELPSKSGQESVGVIAFLMTQPQTAEIKAAVQAGLAWYESDAVKVPNTAYVSRPDNSTDDMYNPIQARAGSTMWYRFYDLDQDVGFFSGRLPTENPPGAGKQYDIMEIEAERRYGYQWGGSYGTPLITYADRVGY
jgi:PelA/Pel-15E family pectate lyase